ncbi:MAG: VWA domain-containing protein [Candidatus Ancaeobacter aquaticus]|nr:VWA domain-containing protein [Candidatus Ancaeobacter aquaticus]
MKIKLSILMLIAFVFSVCSQCYADKNVYIEYILDASNSMNETLPDGQKKIDAAKTIMSNLIDNIYSETKDTNVGLRIYGANFDGKQEKKAACLDSVLVVPISPIDANLLKQKIASTNAAGYTPIAHSLELAAQDFKKGKSDKNSMVLVSDGIETCGGDPIAVAKKLIAQGFNVKIYTIGFVVDEKAKAQLKGIAAATGGKYFDAKDADQLKKSLEEIKNRSFEGYEASGKDVTPTLWIANAPEIEKGDYKGTLAMQEAKFYKAKVYKDQTIKTSMIVKKTPYGASNNVIHQTFAVKLFDNDLNEVAFESKDVEGNPDDVVTFKATWKADKDGWVYIACAASKNHDWKGAPIKLYPEDSVPAPSQYTLKLKVKGKAPEKPNPVAFKKYPEAEDKGGVNFESASEIKVNDFVMGDIYLTESRYYKIPVSEGIEKLMISAVVKKPWYQANNDVINMTYSLKIFDEDWVEMKADAAIIAWNPSEPSSIVLSVDVEDNDEIYFSLNSSDNHGSRGASDKVGVYPKDFQGKPENYSVLVQ